jgi:toxin-antitoxin system PIN domain toxin
MQIPDVNVLIGAFRRDAPAHTMCKRWLDDRVNGDEVFGLVDLACSGFLRVVTHPRIFDPPDSIREALHFVRTLREQPNCAIISPGERHWSIFANLCEQADARGDLVPDAYFAALAIESGSEWITVDRDYARFTGLRWRSPGE